MLRPILLFCALAAAAAAVGAVGAAVAAPSATPAATSTTQPRYPRTTFEDGEPVIRYEGAKPPLNLPKEDLVHAPLDLRYEAPALGSHDKWAGGPPPVPPALAAWWANVSRLAAFPVVAPPRVRALATARQSTAASVPAPSPSQRAHAQPLAENSRPAGSPSPAPAPAPAINEEDWSRPRPIDGYDYPAVLTLALGFFNAQRSGHLPPANPVPWRGDSALGDAAAGRSLAGGFYDAGDHLKLHLPLAWSLSNLAWAMVAFPDAFPRGGDAARSAAATLKWGAAYLMACNLGAGRFVAQVGSEGADHGYWGRPEDMAMPRPVLVVDGPGGKPGSDVVGGAVAALAATAVALKHTDPAFASACVASARDLYGLATTYEGTYSSALPVGNLYPSSSYLDELAWAAAWLGRATSGEQPGGGSPTTAGTSAWFLVRARSYWGRAGAEHGGLANSLAHFWSETYAAAAVLLAADTGGPEYSAYLWRFAQAHVGGSWPLSYTPAGLSYRHQWGSLRMATGSATVIAAFGALLAPTDPGTARKFSCWARGQVRYALGDTGRSFVAGYGARPPTRPHHRAASCPPFTPGTAGRNSPTCGHEAFVNPGPNPNVLTGALIGGPDAADTFVDTRDDYVKCEVALDYQAAFVGALAGVVASGPGETWGACLAAFPGALRPIKWVGV